MYQLNLVSTMVAQQIAEALPGIPTENRVLLISPKSVNTTKAGIIIPGQVKEGVPRKGVVLKVGMITEDYTTYKPLLEVGRVVTYGMYAGKELEFNPEVDDTLRSIMDDSIFTVLSMNEIIYVEPNNVN